MGLGGVGVGAGSCGGTGMRTPSGEIEAASSDALLPSSSVSSAALEEDEEEDDEDDVEEADEDDDDGIVAVAAADLDAAAVVVAAAVVEEEDEADDGTEDGDASALPGAGPSLSETTVKRVPVDKENFPRKPCARSESSSEVSTVTAEEDAEEHRVVGVDTGRTGGTATYAPSSASAEASMLRSVASMSSSRHISSSASPRSASSCRRLAVNLATNKTMNYYTNHYFEAEAEAVPFDACIYRKRHELF